MASPLESRAGLQRESSGGNGGSEDGGGGDGGSRMVAVGMAGVPVADRR